MVELEPGHLYTLGSIDGEHYQELQFVERVGPNYPGNTRAHPGTTIQEVQRVIIARLKSVNSQKPCNETEASIILARQMILQLEMRAKRVKGKELPYLYMDIELYETCPTCGHILCDEIHAPA
jgi:hypothetical protein